MEKWCAYGVCNRVRDATLEEVEYVRRARGFVANRAAINGAGVVAGVFLFGYSIAAALGGQTGQLIMLYLPVGIVGTLLVAVSLPGFVTRFGQWLRLTREKPPYRVEEYSFTEEVAAHARVLSDVLGLAAQHFPSEASVLSEVSGLRIPVDRTSTSIEFPDRYTVPFVEWFRPIGEPTEDVITATPLDEQTPAAKVETHVVSHTRQITGEEADLFRRLRARTVFSIATFLAVMLAMLVQAWRSDPLLAAAAVVAIVALFGRRLLELWSAVEAYSSTLRQQRIHLLLPRDSGEAPSTNPDRVSARQAVFECLPPDWYTWRIGPWPRVVIDALSYLNSEPEGTEDQEEAGGAPA